MKFLLVTDAWDPQINGVVRTWKACLQEFERGGDETRVIAPGLFRTIPCPTYPEIRLSVFPSRKVRTLIEEFQPDAIHIATEGPLGLAARRFCLSRQWPFTTSFHTRFPEYIRARKLLPLSVGYSLVKWFHKPARHVLVPTLRIQEGLEEKGFENLALWNRGVDTELFRPGEGCQTMRQLPGPVHLYVGRIAIEKNLEAFLGLELEGSKVVVGDGPRRVELEAKYPEIHFLGTKQGTELANCYRAADVFVFPSVLDTYGLVMLEALACGTPVAAMPVPGPIDVIGDAPIGVLDHDLARACRAARDIPRSACREFALTRSWAQCAARLRSTLQPIPKSNIRPLLRRPALGHRILERS